MASELLVNKITPESGTTLTLGESGDTIAITSGASLTGFTSTGIDDNATNTAITIDSSQNVGIGTTSPSVTFDAEANGATVAHFNRTTDDGNILELQKDGTTVGSIGYISSGLYIDGESGHAGLRFGGADISPRDGGADADAAIQLGSSSNRFTDLYLSGSVYLGGTTSANALDDYEEGTWTPTYTTTGTDFSSITYDPATSATYTKVGDICYINCFIRTDSVTVGSASSNIVLDGLPFTAADGHSSMAVSYSLAWSTNNPSGAHSRNGHTQMSLFYKTTANGSSSTLTFSDMATGTNDNQLFLAGFYKVV